MRKIDQMLYEAQAQASEHNVSECNVTHTHTGCAAPCTNLGQVMKAVVLHWLAVNTSRSYAQARPVVDASLMASGN